MHNLTPGSFEFIKYQANGNDFIIFVNSKTIVSKITEHAQKLCDRNFGIGADGIILITVNETYLSLNIINADGSKALNCGNGLRCAAKWYFDEFKKEKANIKLANKNYIAEKIDQQIIIAMGECKVLPGEFKFQNELEKIISKVFLVNTGNEHLVFILKYKSNLDDIIKQLKKELVGLEEYNLGFTYQKDSKLYSQVFERGVGFTKSCGTGAIAAAAAIFFNGNIISPIEVIQPGGKILVYVNKTESPNFFNISQQSAAFMVFKGQIQI